MNARRSWHRLALGLGPVFLASTGWVMGHEGTCDAKVWRHLNGVHIEDLEDQDLPEIVRVVYPDSARNIEPDDDRLNVAVDAQNQVIDVWCG